MIDSIDTLVDELSSFTLPPAPKTNIENVKLTEDNINDYVLKRTSTLIDSSINAIEDIKDYVVQGQNPDEISALSELINSATKALEHLNKINLQNKKAATDKELKTMDIASRKEVASLLPDNNVINNTNILVASREEIFKKLLSDISEPEVIDVQVLKDPPKED
jgi:hypothetical protein